MLTNFQPVLKNKNFLIIWASQIFSQLTINIMNFVLLIRLFEETGSAIAISLLWVTYSLPAILIGPLASATVDMVDRRKMLMATNFLQCLTILLFALSHRFSFFLVYEVVFIYSLLNQFYLPAESATIPTVLTKKNLARGNSLFFITLQAALILGYGIAGVLNHFLGFDNTLYLGAFFLFLATLCVYYLPPLKTKHKIIFNLEEGIKNFFARIIEGYDFIKGHKTVYLPFLLMLSFQSALAVVVVTIPIFASGVVKIDLNLTGIYVIVPAAIGALTGAANLPKLMAKGWRKKKIIENSLITLFLILSSLVFVLPALNYWLRSTLAFLAIMIAGFAFVGVIIPAQTFLQETTPSALRGRVFGNFWFLTTTASIIPVVFSGTIIELLGVKFLLLLLALVTLGAYLISTKYADDWLRIK
jgi:MFS family permease